MRSPGQNDSLQPQVTNHMLGLALDSLPEPGAAQQAHSTHLHVTPAILQIYDGLVCHLGAPRLVRPQTRPHQQGL